MIDFNPPSVVWWNCMSYSSGMFSKLSGRHQYFSAVRLQGKKDLLLTNFSEYERRIVLPFFDQIHEEREVLRQNQLLSCALASNFGNDIIPSARTVGHRVE